MENYIYSKIYFGFDTIMRKKGKIVNNDYTTVEHIKNKNGKFSQDFFSRLFVVCVYLT